VRLTRMTVFFQHVGEVGGNRDFPRTIGTPTDGLKRFHFADVEPHLGHLPANEITTLSQAVSRYAPQGFQIWAFHPGREQFCVTFKSVTTCCSLERSAPAALSHMSAVLSLSRPVNVSSCHKNYGGNNGFRSSYF
jgi:hypothetical protein